MPYHKPLIYNGLFLIQYKIVSLMLYVTIFFLTFIIICLVHFTYVIFIRNKVLTIINQTQQWDWILIYLDVQTLNVPDIIFAQDILTVYESFLGKTPKLFLIETCIGGTSPWKIKRCQQWRFIPSESRTLTEGRTSKPLGNCIWLVEAHPIFLENMIQKASPNFLLLEI